MIGEELTAIEELKKEATKLEGRNFSNLRQQIEAEYQLAISFMGPKFDIWTPRLKLYSNLRRKKAAIGDPLLFTTFQTVFASLYDDELHVTFLGRTEGDVDTAENLNSLSKYDQEAMQKDKMDFMWDFDTCFFGRGLTLLHEFYRDEDAKIFVPMPEVLDPMTFLRDPRAISINGAGVHRRNASRFFGWEIYLTKGEMKEEGTYFNLHRLRRQKGSDIRNLVEKGRMARAEAQGLEDLQNKGYDLQENAEYPLLQWYTYWKGKKVIVVLGNNRRTVVRYQELKEKIWPVIDRSLYPISHDWDGVSIPDIIEDKQRARAVITNMMIKSLKVDLYPMYIYDRSRIPNKAHLDFEFNKHIPVQGPVGEGVVQPLRKAAPNLQLASYILETLDMAAQRATATPEIQQGVVSEERRTLGELNIVAGKVDTRFSLAAKIFGWSEKRFWRQYYYLYKEHFEDGTDEKVVRLMGAFGPKWKEMRRENFVCNIDPDIEIASKIISMARKLRESAELTQYVALVMQEPGANRRYMLRKLGRLKGLGKDELERILPPTIDELQAEDENEDLSNNEMVEVSRTDNHPVHMEIHAKAFETSATFAHIDTHKEAMKLKKETPELFPEPPPEEQPIAPKVPGIRQIEGGGSAPTARPALRESAAKPAPEGRT